MEFKFFSPYKATYIFGLINSLLLLIIYIIVLIIPYKCNSINVICNYERNIYSYIDYLRNLLFNNIKNLFKVFESREIVFKISLSIFLSCTSLIFNIIINKYTVCHLFLFEQNKEIIQLFLFFRALVILHDEIDKEYKYLFIILIIVLVLEFFAILVFIECIELNCFELNKNTKKNILRREIQDLIDNNVNDSDILNDNEINY